jgi:glucan phosphoethanolaminetransferase (alkaline phosphatase superfamily)
MKQMFLIFFSFNFLFFLLQTTKGNPQPLFSFVCFIYILFNVFFYVVIAEKAKKKGAANFGIGRLATTSME